MSLFERAVADYLSVPLWLEYLDYLISLCEHEAPGSTACPSLPFVRSVRPAVCVCVCVLSFLVLVHVRVAFLYVILFPVFLFLLYQRNACTFSCSVLDFSLACYSQT